MDPTRILAFALAAAVLAAVPGPSVLFVVSSSLLRGRRAGVRAALGDNCGKLVQVVAVAAGAGLVLEQSVAVFEAVKLAGAAYLMYLGVQTIRHRARFRAALGATAQSRTVGRDLWDGLVVGATNPKGAVIMTAVLPQFVDPRSGAVPLQLLTLGAIFLGLTLVADLAWAMGAGLARSWVARAPRRVDVVGVAGGTALIGLGVAVAVSGRNT